MFIRLYAIAMPNIVDVLNHLTISSLTIITISPVQTRSKRRYQFDIKTDSVEILTLSLAGIMI